jgi:GT2 family glycosyltransferase
MFFSLIVASYNSAGTLRLLLDSLRDQEFTDFETIVVDDASTDDTAGLVAGYPALYLCMPANGGPAAARNYGVTKSSGQWLVFTDADTEFKKDTLCKIKEILERSDAAALVGIYAGKPANPGFAPRYKALWEYYAINLRFTREKRELYPISIWAPRPGVVSREVFDSIGGFDTHYKGADIEDVVLGYRLFEAGYPIYYAPSVRIEHHYPATLLRALRPFFRRCAMWMRTAARRKKLDCTGDGSPDQALAHACGFAAFLAATTVPLSPFMTSAALGGALLYTVLNLKFLALAYREEGAWFMLRSYATRWLFSISAGLAASYGLFTFLLGKR